MREIFEFLTGGRVQVWPVMSSAPWTGRILAGSDYGFLFQSDMVGTALGAAPPPIFVTWHAVTHINRLPEEAYPDD